MSYIISVHRGVFNDIAIVLIPYSLMVAPADKLLLTLISLIVNSLSIYAGYHQPYQPPLLVLAAW